MGFSRGVNIGICGKFQLMQKIIVMHEKLSGALD